MIIIYKLAAVIIFLWHANPVAIGEAGKLVHADFL